MSDLRERVIAAIKAKGPHAKASTIADAAIAIVLEEAAKELERLGIHGGAAAIRALANPASGS